MNEIATTENEGSLTGSIFMIAGCCIGAGMISLPAVTAVWGFYPSIAVLAFSWIFMISTGLLLLEVNLLFPKNTNLLTMAEKLLGKTGKTICAALFIFLFSSLIVAYFSGAGELLASFLSLLLKRPLSPIYGNALVALLLICLLFKGTNMVDLVNRVFIVGMGASYLLLVGLGANSIDFSQLAHFSFGRGLALSLPVLIVSFGYQNLLPSLTSYLGGNKKKLQIAIIVGCTIPLVIYLVWEVILLGMLTQGDVQNLALGQNSEFILHFLQKAIASPHLSFLIQSFSFFALLTSLITVGLSFCDFIRDRAEDILPTILKTQIPLLIVLPSLILSIFIPNFFLKGLSMAGGLGAVILFGAIPVIMCWKVRYHSQEKSSPILRGGKIAMALLILISFAIFGIELFSQFNGG